MFEVQLPALRKLQHVAGTAAGIGFVFGLLIPVVAIFALNWHCPFGDGILQIGGFLVLTAIGSAIILGNLTALVLIGVSKYRQMGSVRKPNLPGEENSKYRQMGSVRKPNLPGEENSKYRQMGSVRKPNLPRGENSVRKPNLPENENSVRKPNLPEEESSVRKLNLPEEESAVSNSSKKGDDKT